MTNCYVCGYDKRLTEYQYPKEKKIVCVDCYKTLVKGKQVYDERMEIVPKTIEKKKPTPEEKRKALEQIFTDSLNENWEKWNLPKGKGVAV